MNNLFKKYSEIRNAIRHIIANDQTLMKLLYYNVKNPLSKEDISIGHIENTHFFMDARAYNNLDDNGETIVDKEKVILMFNWEVNDIKKSDMFTITIQPIVLISNELIEIQHNEGFNRMTAILERLNYLFLTNNGTTKENGEYNIASIGDIECISAFKTINTPFTFIGNYAVYKVIVYGNNRVKWI